MCVQKQSFGILFELFFSVKANPVITRWLFQCINLKIFRLFYIETFACPVHRCYDFIRRWWNLLGAWSIYKALKEVDSELWNSSSHETQFDQRTQLILCHNSRDRKFSLWISRCTHASCMRCLYYLIALIELPGSFQRDSGKFHITTSEGYS